MSQQQIHGKACEISPVYVTQQTQKSVVVVFLPFFFLFLINNEKNRYRDITTFIVKIRRVEPVM